MKVLVVGDSCKDIFRYGKVKRLAPEAPVAVFNPVKEKTNDGMARNVSKNVEALGVSIHTITNPNSIKKVRYVDDKSNQLVLRVDEHDYCDRIDNMILSTIQNNKCHISMTGEVEVNAIIISDYDKLDKWIVDCDYLKINDLEYEQNKDFFETSDGDYVFNKTIITRGRNGCEFQGQIYSTEDVPVKDISGAGDTFLAGLTTEYVKTGDILSAILFAQDCTKIVVQKHGVSTI